MPVHPDDVEDQWGRLLSMSDAELEAWARLQARRRGAEDDGARLLKHAKALLKELRAPRLVEPPESDDPEDPDPADPAD